MMDFLYVLQLTTIIGGGLFAIAVMEWISLEPPMWVVKVRMWLNRRKR